MAHKKKYSVVVHESADEQGLLRFCCRSVRFVSNLQVGVMSAPYVPTIPFVTEAHFFFPWWISEHRRPSQITYLRPVLKSAIIQ